MSYERKRRPPTIAIEPENYEILTNLYEKSNSKSLMKFGNEIISDYINKTKFLKRFAPYLSIYKTVDSTMSVIDERTNKIANVELKNNIFSCSECKPKPCIHIFYVIAHPKVGQLQDMQLENHVKNTV